MKKVLIYHKRANSLLGGDCYRPFLFVEELQKTCDVTLVLNQHFDIEKAVQTLGMNIDLNKLKIIRISSEGSILRKYKLLRKCIEIRQLQKISKNYDLCISTLNVVDFGKPGYQFICTLTGIEGKAFYDYFMKVKTRTGLRQLVRKISTWFYENIVKSLFGIRSTRRIILDPNEHIYLESHYVEKIVRGYFGDFNSAVFYSPTIFDFEKTNAKDRVPLKVVYVGRLDPSKRITDIIAIVERARVLSGKDLKLEIAGVLPPIPYSDLLRKIVTEKPWVKLIGPVYGNDKDVFMQSGTYAIHAERDEALGIANTEYLKAGLIPIVPDEGGAREVVENSKLSFHTNEEAAQILVRLLEDEQFRKEQLIYCAERAKFFTRDAYMKRQHELLENIINNSTNS